MRATSDATGDRLACRLGQRDGQARNRSPDDGSLCGLRPRSTSDMANALTTLSKPSPADVGDPSREEWAPFATVERLQVGKNYCEGTAGNGAAISVPQTRN